MKIGFIGAGAVNFGGGEGPWDHASRLERIPGVAVVGVADPAAGRARARLERRGGPVWKHAKPYSDYRLMLEEQKPDAVWIGVPPNAHGAMEQGRDIEVCCASAGVHMFIEKPLSNGRPAEVAPVADVLESSGLVVSVGYMFRYSRAVDRMRALLAQTPGGGRSFAGLYGCAYTEIRKKEWWDVRQSGGPIVEQATHFLDMARWLLGDADTGGVRAVSIAAGDALGMLEAVPADSASGARCDVAVPPEYAAPRATAAVWKFRTGAVGSLAHGVLLHGRKYETSIEVWGDGLRLALSDPYGACDLHVRTARSDASERLEFGDDDPYLTEDRVFIDAVLKGDAAGIRSPYRDALKTHELAWSITDAARGGSLGG